MARFEEFDRPEEVIGSCLALLVSWSTKVPSISRADLEQLRYKIDLLEYQLIPKPSWTAPARRQIGNPVCATPACKAGWRQGLINQASPDRDPVWYCQEHEPSYRANGVSAPPGSRPSPGLMLAKAREMADRWGKFLARLEAEAKAKTSPTAGAK